MVSANTRPDELFCSQYMWPSQYTNEHVGSKARVLWSIHSCVFLGKVVLGHLQCCPVGSENDPNLLQVLCGSGGQNQPNVNSFNQVSEKPGKLGLNMANSKQMFSVKG